LLPEKAGMMIGIPEQRIRREEKLEIVADTVFVADRDGAVYLHALLGAEASESADAQLGRRDQPAPFIPRGIKTERRREDHRAALFDRDIHIDEAMLYHLEAADRSTKLLPRHHMR
jgi:hypothetical protein